MAMTFTLVSHLRDQILLLVKSREEHRKHEEAEKERLAIEVCELIFSLKHTDLMFLQAEEARTRGTPVTEASFKTWKAKFDKEMALRRVKDDEEKMKGLSPKEKEEYKKIAIRLTGKFCAVTWIVDILTRFSRPPALRKGQESGDFRC